MTPYKMKDQGRSAAATPFLKASGLRRCSGTHGGNSKECSICPWMLACKSDEKKTTCERKVQSSSDVCQHCAKDSKSCTFGQGLSTANLPTKGSLARLHTNQGCSTFFVCSTCHLLTLCTLPICCAVKTTSCLCSFRQLCAAEQRPPCKLVSSSCSSKRCSVSICRPFKKLLDIPCPEALQNAGTRKQLYHGM